VFDTNRIGVLIKYGLWVLGTAFSLIVIYKITARFSGLEVWDDAYMFARYADNFLAHGTIAFNPGGEPTYGLTSLAFLLVVVPMRLLLSESSPLAMILSSAVSGLLMIVALVMMLRRLLADQSREVKYFVWVLVLFSLAWGGDGIAEHFVSGMDTTFVMFYLISYILVCRWYRQSRTTQAAAVTAFMGGFAYAVRPDLLIFTVILPAAGLFFADSNRARKQAGWILSGTVVLVLIQMAVFALYFDSSLPLPFYAKSLGLYGSKVYEQYRDIPWMALRQYIGSFPLLFAVVVLTPALMPCSYWRQSTWMDKGSLAATLVFITYYLFFVLQIMYYAQRFYYPTLPALIFLATRSVILLDHRVSLSGIIHRFGRRTSVQWAAVIALVACYVLFGMKIANDSHGFDPDWDELADSFDVRQNYRQRWSKYWFCLDRFSELDGDLSIATSEVGYPLAMNPERVIIDLSGLNETATAREGFSARRLFLQYQPDLIYMPHPSYEEMIRQIRRSPYFLEHYELYTADLINARMDVAINRDSRYYRSMRAIMIENMPDSTERR
jgi:hypothetical protein